MLHLIAYDITSPRRLKRVMSVCEDYGVRIEKSVFEMDLPNAVFLKFWRKISEIIDDESDAVIDCRVPKLDAIRTIGRVYRPLPGPLIF